MWFGESEIHSFFGHHTGQARVCVVRDHHTQSESVLKLYGLGAKIRSDASHAYFSRAPNPNWKRIYQNEVRVARNVGELFPHFPMLYGHGEHDGLYWLLYSFGRRSLHREASGPEAMREHRVLTLEEVLNGTPLIDTSERRAQIASFKSSSWKRKAELFLQMIDIAQALHDIDVVHNDLKVSQFVILDGPGEAPLVQGLDVGMAFSLPAARGERDAWQRPEDALFFLSSPTTVHYNAPQKLALALQAIAGTLRFEEVSRSVANYPERYTHFDCWSLALVGCRLFGRDPLLPLLRQQEDQETGVFGDGRDLAARVRRVRDAHALLAVRQADPHYTFRDLLSTPAPMEGVLWSLLFPQREADALRSARERLDELLHPFRVSRRHFLRVGALATIGAAAYLPYVHRQSASYRRAQLLSAYETAGRVDPELLFTYARALIDDKLRAPLLERAEFVRENGVRVLKGVPQFLSNGRYVNDMLDLLGAGAYARSLLGAAAITRDHDYLERFEEFLSLWPEPDASDERGYRIARYAPLVLFLEEQDALEQKTGYSFSHATVERSRSLLAHFLRIVKADHLDRDAPVRYIKASTGDFSRFRDFPYVLRSDAARLARPIPRIVAALELPAREQDRWLAVYENHTRLSHSYLRTPDGTQVYDKAFLGLGADGAIRSRPGSDYGTLTDGTLLRSYALTQVLMARYFQSDRDRGMRDAHTELLRTYARNERALGFPPEYLLSPEQLPPLSGAPPALVSSENPYPFAVFVAARAKDAPRDTLDRLVVRLVRLLDNPAPEGVLPGCKRENTDMRNVYIESDCAVLYALQRSLQRTEE